jgi:5-methylcytosine-specific restriction endonuclease McrA
MSSRLRKMGGKKRNRRVEVLMNGHDSVKCFYCPKILVKSTVTLDHVIPISKGGTHELSNLVLACYKCNNEKGNDIIIDYCNSKKVFIIDSYNKNNNIKNNSFVIKDKIYL